MKVNPTYRSLLDKSVESMLSAIEIYNKPKFQYREETFAILAVNSWELLLKAYLLKQHNYNKNSIYELEPAKCKNGKPHRTRKVAKLNRSNNPRTISINEALMSLEKELPKNLKNSIELLIELRDNAIHFTNTGNISKQVQELGFACIKDYISIIKQWNLEINLSQYNLYLMPLAYIDNKRTVNIADITTETQNFINYVLDKLQQEDKDDNEYYIAMKIDIDFKKGNSFNALPIKYDTNGTPFNVNLTEEDIRNQFPLSYREVTAKCKNIYTDYKQDRYFNKIMKGIKNKGKLCYERKLDNNNPKTPKQVFYSSNIFKELDNHYNRK